MDAAPPRRRRARATLLAALAALLIGGAAPRAQAPAPSVAAPPVAAPPVTGDDAAAAPVDFARDIRPILAGRCIECHGAERARSGLRLDSRAAALRGGESGLPALVPGAPDAGELLARVTSSDPFERMPPDDRSPLNADQLALLRRWIAEGASWEDPPAEHWAWTPVQRAPVPAVRDTEWVRDPLDAFVLARLEAAGLRPSPPADVVTLARRAALDLTGLPPDPAEIDALAADPSTWTDYVERLLASPHFAERWARHWLDKAAYADSDGYENDKARPEAWRWRDWVIDAVARDLPYDRFLEEQIAGDLLPDADRDTRIATGFYRQTLTNTEAGVDPEEFRVKAVLDRVDLTGTALLGMTTGCARCHDHKYDPLATREYYALAAFFDNADESTLQLPPDPAALAAFEREREALKGSLKRLGRAYAQARRRYLERAPSLHPLRVEGADATGTLSAPGATPADAARELRHVARGAPPRVAGFALDLAAQDEPSAVVALRVAVGGRELVVREVQRSAHWGTPGVDHHVTWATAEPLELGPDDAVELTVSARGPLHAYRLTALTGSELHTPLPAAVRRVLGTPEHLRTPAERDTLTAHETAADPELRAAVQAFNRERRKLPERPRTPVPVLAERLEERRSTHVLERGDFLRPGAAVEPDTPGVLPPLRPRGARADRLDLARWITRRDHPLTARVFVNDVWQRLFGEGLVRTPGDLGTRGAPPSHPALLDHLAAHVLDNGWSRKDLLRRILHSSTYRQAAAHRAPAEQADPDNRLLHRQARVRVEAEIVRDQALAVGGLLNPAVGGPSVFPPLPAGVADKSYANLFTWTPSEGPDRYRRGLYTFFKRTAPHPHLVEFDAPPSLTSCVRRERSNTPLQALITLNDPVFTEAAAGLARRVLAEADDAEARLARAFRLCLGRAPTAAEREALHALRVEARAHYDAHADDSARFVGAADPELAAWTAALRVLLNLDEFLVRP